MPEKYCALRIEPARQKIERDAPAVRAQDFWIAHTRERMIIGDEVKRFAFGLQRDGRPHHAEVVADVQNAAGLNTGQDSHVLICHPERSRRISVSFSFHKLKLKRFELVRLPTLSRLSS